MIKIVAFDLWNTLIYHDPKYKVFSKISKTLDVKEEVFWNFMEKTWLINSKMDEKLFFTELCKYLNKTECVDELIKIWRNDRIHIYKHSKELLEKLKKRFRLIIASNAEPYTKKILKNNGLDVYFEKIILSSGLGVLKPEKEFFIKILKILKEKPENICVIGDSLKDDIKTPKKMGFKTMLIDRNNKYGKFRGIKIKSLYQLLNCLYNI